MFNSNSTIDKPDGFNEIERLIKQKLDYNHNGLFMNSVDNSTIILLAKIQAKEQKRSLARKELIFNNLTHNLSSKINKKPTRSLIDSYLKSHLLNRKIRHNRQYNVDKMKQQDTRTVIIDQPNQSLARVTFNFNNNSLIKSLPMKLMNKKYLNRQARLLKDNYEQDSEQDKIDNNVILDHLVLAKSFVLKKN